MQKGHSLARALGYDYYSVMTSIRWSILQVTSTDFLFRSLRHGSAPGPATAWRSPEADLEPQPAGVPHVTTYHEGKYSSILKVLKAGVM